VTFQIGLVGEDGVLLASDQAMVRHGTFRELQRPALSFASIQREQSPIVARGTISRRLLPMRLFVFIDQNRPTPAIRIFLGGQ
jgi:hypothetical protein